MPDQMHLIIILQKPVADVAEANVLAEFVKEKLQPYPDVLIDAKVNNHIDLED